MRRPLGVLRVGGRTLTPTPLPGGEGLGSCRVRFLMRPGAWCLVPGGLVAGRAMSLGAARFLGERTA
ncbi:hypothetical protein E1J23_12840 [Xanthomonas gardneri]|nr:hypothetical protein [Xanthomonas hortorum pv. gardneri]